MATIIGNNGINYLNGTSDGDVIEGRGGNDLIFAWDGNDEIDAGNGNDHVDAGTGDDFVDGGNGNDIIYGGTGFDTIYGGNGNDVVWGGADNDNVYGENGNDVIFGEGGVDYVEGGNGNDVIWGGTENDILYGDRGNDVIDGGNGHDDITGGFDADVLTGGSGIDHFIYNSSLESTHSKTDLITDFQHGQDKIDLTQLLGPTVDLDWLGLTGTGAAHSVWFQKSGGYTYVFADVSNDDGADLKIKLVGEFDLEADDFLGVSATIATVSDANALEGVSIVHTVTLSNASAVPTTYTLSLTDGSASGLDYTSTLTNAAFSDGVTIALGVITVPAGVTSFTVSVPTTADTIDEADETYTLTVGAAMGTGTITDDDGLPPTDINVSGIAPSQTTLPQALNLIGTFSTVDPDVGQSHTYTLAGADAASFSITGNQLSTTGVLTPSAIYTFTVTSTDNGSPNQFLTETMNVITGTSASDSSITGTAVDDIIFGASGDDIINGLNGDDTLLGQAGADFLMGGGGNDRLDGGNGNDVLKGEAGIDVLIGGIGNDTLVFDAADLAGTGAVYHGGGGEDLLRFDANGESLTLAGRVGPGSSDMIESIEVIDLTGDGSNTLTLTANDVLDLSSTDILKIDGDLGDVATIGAGWAISAGFTYTMYTQAGATLIVNNEITVII